ncbi:MAG: 1-deoxy-D-xylulose-5-phosphate reductoisomerase [Planctomycetes bacterium]|nr:1-deoxy-D-xylulose-5-phosphate reductoisomerase [Planctomycetota bacterium]
MPAAARRSRSGPGGSARKASLARRIAPARAAAGASVASRQASSKAAPSWATRPSAGSRIASSAATRLRCARARPLVAGAVDRCRSSFTGRASIGEGQPHGNPGPGVGIAPPAVHDRRVPKRRLAILGCTGSVGRQALQVLAEHPDRFEVCLLAAHTSAAGLAAAAATHRSPFVCLTGAAAPPELPAGVAFFPGADGLLTALERSQPDAVLNAITGAAGLAASSWTLGHGRQLLLANKESLVVAGQLLIGQARDSGATILPIDSEHCAVHQCLAGANPRAMRRLWLTASGGPFRDRPLASFAAATPTEALRHPTWSMGPRITIGSATMMNKAFEVLEAHWLFGLPSNAIEVIVHPQSIVHSMVEFVDGTMLAQCGVPDMRVPLRYCLGHPERLPSSFQPFDPVRWRQLEFLPVEPERYPAVGLAYEVLRLGGDSGAVLNAADEVATAAFLDGRLPFPAIVDVVARAVRERTPRPIRSLQDALDADAEGRRLAAAAIDGEAAARRSS